MGENRERRRNCVDRMRAELMTRQIRRQKRIDPAMSVAVRLMALTSFLINLFPASSPRPGPFPEPPPFKPTREPPLEPEPRTYKRAPSWPQLMRDLAAPVRQAMARAEVYNRLPIEVRPWLDDVFKQSDWSSIRVYVRSGATDEDVSRGVLAAFRTWKAEQEEAARARLNDTTGGKGAGAGSRPGHGDDPEDDKRPFGPK